MADAPDLDLHGDSSGFWDHLRRTSTPPDAAQLFPLTSDRFAEAEHFLCLLRELQPSANEVNRANWYAGAYLTAVVSIFDVARSDNISEDTPLLRERGAKNDEPEDGDPYRVNQVLRELRNIRLHLGEPIIEPKREMLPVDIMRTLESLTNDAPLRWFLHPPDDLALGSLKSPLLSPAERTRFHDRFYRVPFVSLMSQHLYVLKRSFIETYNQLAIPQ
ncbi:MAG: hypothetical protein M0Z69_14665 [Actinomycetota bacterium]|nr:hypothetical protein [Actinomycetota bacterium]